MKRLLIPLSLLVLLSPVSAMQVDAVLMPDSVQVAGKKLMLNGAGIRRKFFLDIYAAGLYLAAPSQDGNAIVDADTIMLVRLHFIYDGVDADKLSNGWMKGLMRIVPDADANLQKAMAEFSGLFTVKVKENDIYDITWLPDKGLEVRFNGNLLRIINSLDLKKALFAIWIGEEPGDDALKKGLLGK